MNTTFDQLIDFTAQSMQIEAKELALEGTTRTQKQIDKRISRLKVALSSALYTSVLEGLLNDCRLTYVCNDPNNQAYAELLFEQEKIKIEFDNNTFRIIWHAPIEAQVTDWIESRELQKYILRCLATIRMIKQSEAEERAEFMNQLATAQGALN